MRTEKYYGVRIGDPRRHFPYLMLGPDRKTPALFQTYIEAVNSITDDIDKSARVVVARINYGK